MTPVVKAFFKKFCTGPNTCLVLIVEVILIMDLNISTEMVLFILRTHDQLNRNVLSLP